MTACLYAIRTVSTEKSMLIFGLTSLIHMYLFFVYFGKVNISCGQVENEVQLVHGQVEKILNSTPLYLKY